MSQDLIRDKTQQYAKRTFKRVVLPLFVFFALINVLIYLVLNIPSIQRKIVSYINKEFLKPYSYQLSLDSLDVELIPTQLVLNKIRVGHVTKAWNPGTNRTEETTDQNVDIIQVKVGLHLLESYVKSRFVLSDLEIYGLDLKSTLPKSDKPFDIEAAIKNLLYKNGRTAFENIRLLLPDSIKIKDVNIELQNSMAQWQHRIGIGLISIRKPREFSPRHIFLNIQLNAYSWYLGSQNELNTGATTIEATLLKSDVLDIKKLEIDGPIGHIKSSGQFNLKKNFFKSSYKFKVDANVLAKPSLMLADLSGDGKVNFTGEVRTTGKLDAPPLAVGHVNWEAFEIDGFDVHTGNAQVEFENLKIHGEKIEIKTPRGATIRGQVVFQLFDAFPFSGQLSAENWQFTELMKGLGNKTDVLDFALTANKINVHGEIFRKKDNMFFIRVRSDDIEAQNLHIPRKEFADDRPPLPDCNVSLSLYSDEKYLDLGTTNLSCSEDDSVVAQKGIVTYSDTSAEFILQGKNFDVSILEYFLKRPTSGLADIDGVLTVSNQQPLTFAAKVAARNAVFFGFPLKTMSGNIVLTPDEISGTKLFAKIKDKNDLSWQLDSFSVRFEDLKARFNGSATGFLSTRLLAVAGYTEPSAPVLEGKIGLFNFSIDGPILHPQSWSFLGKFDLQQPRFVNLAGSRLRLDLNCKFGNCENSRMQWDEIRSAYAATSGEVRPGSVVVDLKRITNEEVNLRAQLSLIPLQAFITGDSLAGVADLRLDMIGRWDGWTGDATGRIDGLRIGAVDFGPVLLTGRARPKQGLLVDLSAKYNQIVLQSSFPSTLDGPSKINLKINNYDMFAETKSNFRQQFGLISRLSAEFNFAGPGPLSHLPPETSLVNLWSMDGAIRRLDLDASQLSYRLAAPVRAQLRHGILKLETARLVSGGDKMHVSGRYNLNRNEIEATLSLNSGLTIFEALTPRITSAQGRVAAELSIEGTAQAPSIQGFIKVNGKKLMLKDFAPEFTDIEADIEFSENNAEIRRVRARKGGGQIDAVGSIDWSRMSNGKAEYPLVNVRVTADQLQTRLPPSALGSFDLTTTANIQISGNDIPYLIKGDINLHRAVAVREAVCQELFSDLTDKSKVERINVKKPVFEFDLGISSIKTINLQNPCFRVNASTDVKLKGNTETPILEGNAKIENGSATFLGRRYLFKRADLAFDNPVRIDPRLDIQTMAEVSSYKIYINITGTALQFKTDMWAEPSTLPSGETLTRQDIARMLSTGQVPNRTTTSSQGGYILANNAADALSTQFDDPLSQALSKITGGIIDNVQIRPQLEEGENKLKARISKSIGERLSLGVDFDLAPSTTRRSQSLNGTYLLNDTVNLQGGLERTTDETTTTEVLGGLRFQFGRD